MQVKGLASCVQTATFRILKTKENKMSRLRARWCYTAEEREGVRAGRERNDREWSRSGRGVSVQPDCCCDCESSFTKRNMPACVCCATGTRMACGGARGEENKNDGKGNSPKTEERREEEDRYGHGCEG